MKKQMKAVLLLTLLVALLALTALVASAATYTVSSKPGSYTTLASAVNAATSGDTITVSGNESGVVPITISKNLTLAGTGSVTFSGAGFTVSSGKLTITGGSYTAQEGIVVNIKATGAFAMTGGTLTAPTATNAYVALYTLSTDCVLSGSTTVHGTLQPGAAGVLTIKGGTYDSPSYYHENTKNMPLIFANSKNDCKVRIEGGTFTKDSSDVDGGLLVLNDSYCLVEVTGGIFTVNGKGHLVLKRNGNLAVNGGTFIGNTDESLFCVALDNAGVYHGISIANSNLIGNGMLIDGLKAVDPVVANNCTVIYRGADPTQVVSRGVSLQNSTLMVKKSVVSGTLSINVGVVAMISQNSPLMKYAGEMYYVWMNKAGSADCKPGINNGASVRLEGTVGQKDSNGIRFTAFADMAVVEKLLDKHGLASWNDLSYGILIAPADYVAVAGGFTHEKLNAYVTKLAEKGSGITAASVYADVVARKSLVYNAATGDVSYNAALIGIKEANRNRKFAAVSYIKVGNTYYYSDFSTDNTRSIKEIVAAAWEDDEMIWLIADPADEPVSVTLGGRHYGYAPSYSEKNIKALYDLSIMLGVYTNKHCWQLISDTPASCESVGCRIYQCTEPDCTVEDRVVIFDKLAHTYPAGNNVCSVCGYTEGNFDPILRFAVTSDVHTRTDGAYDSLKRLDAFYKTAYGYSSSQPYGKLDGIFVVGDYTHDGGAGTDSNNAMTLFFNYVNKNTSSETLLRVVLGNHEFYYTTYDDGTCSDTRYSDTSVKNTNANHELLSGAPVNNHDVINGIHFITLSMDKYDKSNGIYYSDAKLDWLKQELAKAAAADPTGQKPIFVFEHVGPSGAGGSDKNLNAIFAQYPQVVNFSGHSHTALSNPASIIENAYISINTGSLANVGILHADYGTVLATDHAGGWGTSADMEESVRSGYLYYFVEIDAAYRVRLVLYDFASEAVAKIVDFGNVGNAADRVPNSVKKANAKAPVFAAGATLTPVVISSTSALFKIPQATTGGDNSGNSAVSGYTVVVTDSDGNVMPLTNEATYRLSCAHLGVAMPDHVLAPITGLSAGKSYTVTVTPINYWGHKGDPLVYTFNTSNTTGGKKALFKASFGADGSAVNAVDGKALRPSGNATTVYDSVLGRYVAQFDGNSSYNFDGMTSFYDVLTDGLTLETYVYMNRLPATDTYNPASNMEGGGFGFQIKANGAIEFLIHPKGTDAYSRACSPKNTIVTGEWIHLVGTYDGSYIRLYVNGEEVASESCAGLMEWPNGGASSSTNYAEARYLCIGGDSGSKVYGGTNLIPGKVANVSLFAEALTATEVQAIYNQAKP